MSLISYGVPPPCPTHSQIRKIATFSKETGEIRQKPVYPDMQLYEEILLLQGYFKGKYCVENVIAWYDPLIQPQEFASHWFWANFIIRPNNGGSRNHYGTIEELGETKGFNLDSYKGIDKRKALRNCVEPETGKRILECVINPIETQNSLNL